MSIPWCLQCVLFCVLRVISFRSYIVVRCPCPDNCLSQSMFRLASLYALQLLSLLIQSMRHSFRAGADHTHPRAGWGHGVKRPNQCRRKPKWPPPPNYNNWPSIFRRPFLVVTLQNNNRHTSARAQKLFHIRNIKPMSIREAPSPTGGCGGLSTGSGPNIAV